MFFSIKELEVRKLPFDVELRPGEIEFEGGRLKQSSALQASGVAELLSDTLGEIRIQGKLAVELETECDRCLEPVRHPMANDFDLFYRPTPKGAPHEAAIDEGESQIGFYEGAGIELEEILREHILLSLPMQLVCREECQGICPQCGQNRNAGSCHCETKLVDDRWAALRELKAELK